jgi:hydroxyethylthiazole kinase
LSLSKTIFLNDPFTDAYTTGAWNKHEILIPEQSMYGPEFADILGRVRLRRPLIHHITNYVTVNDCANITLCAGGAPVMADAKEEVAEMASVSSSLVLNIGTLNQSLVESMIVAGTAANKAEIPVILDPVGAGATRYRTETAHRLLDELKISVLKGNAGEIGVLAGAKGVVRGVESGGLKGDPVEIAREYARDAGLTVIITGETDIVTDGTRTLLVENGDPMMGIICGTGCMATSVVGTFAAVSHDPVMASAGALAAFGIAGEKAAERYGRPGAFKVALFDELAALGLMELEQCAVVKEA